MPHLKTTLNNYAHWLPPLANVNWSAFPRCFFLTSYIHNWGNSANDRLKIGSGDLILLPLSVHLCLGLVGGYWLTVGICGHHSHSKLCLFVVSFLCFSFATTHLPYFSTYSKSMLAQNQWITWKIIRKLSNQALFTCQVKWHVKANR